MSTASILNASASETPSDELKGHHESDDASDDDDDAAQIVPEDNLSIVDDDHFFSYHHEPLVEVRVEGEKELSLVDVSSPLREICANFSQGTLEFDGKTYFFKCTLCDAEFKTKEALDAHLLWHKETNLFQCGLCHEKFSELSNLDQHLQMHQFDFWCSLCNKGFHSEPEFAYHKILHSKPTNLPITIAPPKSFNSTLDVKAHHKVHSKVRQTFKCDICNKVFKAQKTLQKHHDKHVKESASFSSKKCFSCDFCIKKYTSKKRLKKHIHMIHLDKVKCTICHKAFACKRGLLKHLNTHSKKT